MFINSVTTITINTFNKLLCLIHGVSTVADDLHQALLHSDVLSISLMWPRLSHQASQPFFLLLMQQAVLRRRMYEVCLYSALFLCLLIDATLVSIPIMAFLQNCFVIRQIIKHFIALFLLISIIIT